MSSVILQHHIGYLAVCTLIGLLCAGAAWTLARRRGNPHGAWWSGLAFVLTGVLGVTFMGAGSADGTCVVNHELAEPFHTAHGWWNLAMMVPVGACALMAVRRPLPVLFGVVALPPAIEFTQATVDGLGRACDSSDAEMAMAGGVAGLAIAAIVLAIRHSLVWQAGVKGTLIAFAALFLLGSGLARPMLDLTHVDGSSLAGADSEQKRAVEAAVKEAFGDRYELGRLYEQPCGNSSCTNVIFNLHSRAAGHPEAFATGSLSWPDKQHLNIQLENSDRLTVMGYPLEGVKAPSSDAAASRITRSYAQRKYPWAMGATMTQTSPVGDKAELGWITAWRWTHDNVLMPRMLDVQVDRSGRVSQIDVTLGPTRANLPEVKLDAGQAEKEANKAVAAELRANGNAGAEFHTKAVTVKAVQQDGSWQPNWLVNVEWPSDGKGDAAQEAGAVDMYRVNAVTGQVYGSDGKRLTTS